MHVANLNEGLQMSVETDEKTFRNGSEISLIIYNRSPNFILLDGSSYIRLLHVLDSEWVEIVNELTYSGSRLLSPQGTILLDTAYTKVQPVLEENEVNNSDGEVLLRIVVNDIRTGNLVGAYVDVYMAP